MPTGAKSLKYSTLAPINSHVIQFSLRRLLPQSKLPQSLLVEGLKEISKRDSVPNSCGILNISSILATVVAGCLLYTSDAADEEDSVDLGGRRIIKKKK